MAGYYFRIAQGDQRDVYPRKNIAAGSAADQFCLAHTSAATGNNFVVVR
jgi:hypothetical protein